MTILSKNVHKSYKHKMWKKKTLEWINKQWAVERQQNNSITLVNEQSKNYNTF